jgi:uncharacterized membrane protein YphA (DoxX/SURF4 family)
LPTPSLGDDRKLSVFRGKSITSEVIGVRATVSKVRGQFRPVVPSHVQPTRTEHCKMALSSPSHRTASASRKWTLWTFQALLAAFFLLAGYGHATTPIAELAKSAPWAADIPLALVRFIGIAETTGALGLVLPAATRIVPRLTWVAAAGLSLIMLLAALFHVWRREPFIIQLVIAAVAAFVAWGRATWHRWGATT